MRGLLALAVALVLTAGVAVAGTGQLTNVDVTGGWHGAGAIVFKGVVDATGPKPVTVFICDFSTRVTPEGTWAINVPLGAIVQQGEKGTKVRVRAVQDGTNVVVEKLFDLTDLNRRFNMNLKFQELWGE